MRDYLETFFRRKWLFFVPFLAVVAVAVAGGLYTSWVYEVQARLAVQPNPILEGAGQQLTMPQSDANDEYARLGALLATDGFLKRIINSVPALKENAGSQEKMDAQVERLRRDLNAWVPAEGLINFRYQARNAQTAQQVVSQTLDLFLAQRYADRVGMADQAIALLTTQQQSYQQQLENASTELSAWEASHPPGKRAELSESEQLEFQRLKTNYGTVLDHLQNVINSDLEKARFTREKMIRAQASTYRIADAPAIPPGPSLSANKLGGLLLIGLLVAAGLGFSVVALATWFGGRRPAGATALPAWLDRMMTPEEQVA